MDPALALLDRSLKGDVAALSFLERTASIYVFDGTNPGQPKICGAWDFLSQALTEVERYEGRIMSSMNHSHSHSHGHGHSQNLNMPHSPGGGPASIPNLEGHVQLLATMSRRAARRSPVGDQKLVEVCLSNASYHGSAEQARHLIDSNRHMREREMGRLAAMVFDFSYHNQRHSHSKAGPGVYQSAFSNPIAMESLCAVVAANAISSGPHAFVNLVSDWIVPSVENLPPFAVASVTCHLAAEAMGKSAPVGIGDALKSQLFDPVVSKVLAPMLQESVRESDTNDGDGRYGGRLKNQRTASMVLKALDRWSAATACSLVRIKQVCHNSNVNIIDVISDAMYSDSEMIMDSLAEFLETLLRRHSEDENVLEGLSTAGALFVDGNINFNSSSNSNLKTAANSLHNFEQYLTAEITERRTILSELVSAVGLQRFRFNDRLANGDTGVCRCLTSIAKSIASASQTEIKSGKFQSSERGFIDLLMKSVSHPTIHVCGIALEALVYIITPRSDLATQLLPMLQGKAIVPPSLVGLTTQDECEVDFNEFERFREHLLTEILTSCYTSNRAYYIESCTCAIEEFCSFSANPSPQTAYQLEAALFCLSAVSMDASKRALLVTASPAAQTAAAKACKMRNDENIGIEEISQNSQKHDEHLARTIRALCNAPNSALSNPLFLSQMCRFIGKYAKWISKTPASDVLDCAATLALRSFDRAAIACRNRPESFDEISVSPFADAATALRNILSRSPHRFTSSEALSTLEKGWKSMYDISIGDSLKISMEDKKALCTGITRVLAVLPPDQWHSSLSSLANPTIECIEAITKVANQMNSKGADATNLPQIIERIAEEISVLAIAIRTFNSATLKRSTESNGVESPVLTVLHRVWPCLSLIASTYSLHNDISSSLSELLLVAVTLSEKNQNVLLLTNIHEIAVSMIDTVCKSNEIRALDPIMGLVSGVVDAFGPIADTDAQVRGNGVVSNETRKVREIVEQLTCRSFSAVNAIRADAQVDMLPAMFSICTSSIQRCPILFMTLSAQGDGIQDGQIFVRSVTVAFSSIDEKHVDVARTAMLYLKEVLLSSTQRDGECSNKCKSILSPLRDELITKIIHGTCGNYPREVLDPAANLIYLILRNMVTTEAERIITIATSKDYLRLGEQGRHSVVSTLGKCASASCNVHLIMDLFDDVWTLHQSDESGCESVAGGDHVKKFAQKYNSV